MKSYLLLIGIVGLSVQALAQNVGIGTSTASSQLSIVGRLRIRHNVQTAGIYFDGSTQPARSFIGMLNDDYVGFWGAGSSWNFVMHAGTGNVGIGTTVPTAKLDVNGGFRYRLNFPDYRAVLMSTSDGGDAQWTKPVAFGVSGPIRLYGPGTDSGTFDYFTEAVMGEAGASRPDYTASEDDNVLVQGIAGDEFALGFFGFAYYEENASRLKLVPVDGGNGPLLPSAATINDGTYSPLSRPIFIYLSAAAMARPEVRAFVDFYVDVAPELVSEVGYIPLKEEEYAAAKASIAAFQP